MKYNRSSKVIFKTEIDWVFEDPDWRYIFYKIEPSELSWFDRTFRNPWRRMFHGWVNFSGTGCFFTPEQYQQEIKPLKTYGDVCDYLSNVLKHSQEIEAEAIRISEEKWK